MTSPEHQNRHHETEDFLETNLSQAVNRLVETKGSDAAHSALLDEFLRIAGEHGLGPDTQALLSKITDSYGSRRETAMNTIGAHTPATETALGTGALNNVLEKPVAKNVEHTPEAHHDDHELEREIDALVQSVQGTGFSGKFVNGLHINAVNEQVGAINEKSGGYSDFQGYGQYGRGADSLYSQPLDSIILGCYNQKHSPTLPLLTFMPMKISKEDKVMLAYSFYNNTTDAVNRDTRFSTIFAFLPSGEVPERLEELIRTKPAALPKFLEKIAGGLKELEDEGFPDHISLIGSSEGMAMVGALKKYTKEVRDSRSPHSLARSTYETIRGLTTEVPVASS